MCQLFINKTFIYELCHVLPAHAALYCSWVMTGWNSEHAYTSKIRFRFLNAGGEQCTVPRAARRMTQPFSIMVFWIDNGVLNLTVGTNRQGWYGWNRKLGLESDMPTRCGWSCVQECRGWNNPMESGKREGNPSGRFCNLLPLVYTYLQLACWEL